MRVRFKCDYPIPEGTHWMSDEGGPGVYDEFEAWWLAWVEAAPEGYFVMFDRHTREEDSLQAPEEPVKVTSLDHGLKYISAMLMMGFR